MTKYDIHYSESQQNSIQNKEPKQLYQTIHTKYTFTSISFLRTYARTKVPYRLPGKPVNV